LGGEGDRMAEEQAAKKGAKKEGGRMNGEGK